MVNIAKILLIVLKGTFPTDTLGDLIGNKIADKITNTSSQNFSKTNTTSEIKGVIPKEMYIPPENRQQIIDELRLISYINRLEYKKQQIY